ncbi:hypothetical protein [Mycobacterium avium]|uniref:hypothetical protein n=1 Tax=Mycobacterium avium TaxID=1764 RepID=UPI000CE3447E|nr:hypothetical protein [Mycobacterium avium]
MTRTSATAAPVPASAALTVDTARALTDQIKHDAEALWDKIARAYHGRADVALGYESWDAYCIKEFGTARLRIPREERPEMVTSLRQAGLSYRAIEAATGLSRSTAERAAKARVPNETPAAPEPAAIAGTDGKTYAPRKPNPGLFAPTSGKRLAIPPQPEPRPVPVILAQSQPKPAAAPTVIKLDTTPRPTRHERDAVVSGVMAARTARCDAATVLTLTQQPGFTAAISAAHAEKMRDFITAAITDLQASLKNIQ